jgi:hypothetical protein
MTLLSALIWPKRSPRGSEMSAEGETFIAAHKMPKPQADKVRECLTVYKKLTGELGIPDTNPSLRLFKKRMAEYWREERTMEDRIPLVDTNRYIIYKFPRWAHQEVEVVLRVGRITHLQLPSDLAAEASR